MIRRLGPDSARKLRVRLADLEAAGNVAELVAGRPHPLRGERGGQFAVDLHGGNRLVLEASRHPPPERAHGGIDWRAVDDITIVYIGDYHD